MVQTISPMTRKLLSTLIASLLIALTAACSAFTPPPAPGPSDIGNTQAPPPPPPLATSEAAPETAEETDQSNAPDPFAGLNFKNGWARIPFNATVFGGYGLDQMNDVTAGGPGVVAVGFSSRNGEMNAAVWVSQDGIRWERADGSPELGGTGAQAMNAIAAGPERMVAVGTEGTGSDTNAAVWISQDGLEWTRIPSTGAVFGDESQQAMYHVTAFGDGFIAVGMERTAEEIRGAAWVSRNGISWQRVDHSEAVFGGANRYVTLDHVIPVGESLLVAGSVQLPDSEDIDTAIWFSHDGGATWTEITNSASALGDPGAPRYQIVSAIAQGPGGFIMAGTEQNIFGTSAEEYINGIIWRSTDGLNWERIFDHKPDFQQQTMLDVASGDLGFAAVGYEISGDATQAAAWFSVDGLNWEQVPHFESVFGGNGVQRMNAVAQAGPGLVAVGYTTENEEQDAAVWIYVPEK